MGFDRRCLRPAVGLRAVWLLYKRGKWGLLEDLGLDRNVSEPLLDDLDQRVGRRLTAAQSYKLALIPGVSEASSELRLAYGLKYFDEFSLEDPDESVSRHHQ